MLLTVTSNPAVDRTLHVPRLVAGAVHRAAEVGLTAGGKGLNVTRAARGLGLEVLATGPLAGHSGRLVAELAAREGLAADWHWLDSGETRASLLLTHEHGDATVINEPGPRIEPAAWRRFAAHVLALAGRARAVALSSSMPPGVPPRAPGELARALATDGRAVYLDTSGAALAAALEEPGGLCVKVNRAELAEALGLELPEPSAIVEAARLVLGRGAELVVVTLGAAGAIGVETQGAWHAAAPAVAVQSSVGSGDSLLAGLVLERLSGRSLPEALAFGVACGSANATTRHPGSFEHGLAQELIREVPVRCLT
jgi:1-phosphofructokinase family hexose kinase